MNGVYVRGQRVRSVDIRPGQTINVGNDNGPLLAFDLEAPIRTAPDNLQIPVGPASRRERQRTEFVKRPNAVSRVLRPGAPAAPPGRLSSAAPPDNDVILHDVLVSGHHAFLVLMAQGAEITDANSTNGTYVNGQRVKQAILNNGDVVTLGNSDMVFANGTLARRTGARFRYRRSQGQLRQPDGRRQPHAA